MSSNENGSDRTVPASLYRKLSVAEEMNPLRRNAMEDGHVHIKTLGGDPSTSFFAVFDGHGGRKIVDFLLVRLPQNFTSEFAVDDDADVRTKIERAFLITDIESKQANILTSGATAVVGLLRRDRLDGSLSLYMANVGDSRAIFFDGKTKTRLSQEHKTDDELETRRIIDAGGFILRDRVLGILAITRSFGDHGMKKFIIAQPFISTTVIEQNMVKEKRVFIIMACDGLWDVMDDDEAVAIVIKAINEDNEDSAAGLLIDEALRRNTQDNITVIVVFI